MSGPEHHYITRHGWLRAAVMGANDGIISTSGLLMGMAAAGTDQRTLVITGIAALVAGATSMAAGEYVSVSSHADMEEADLAREAKAITEDFDKERDELVSLYQKRGLSLGLATEVADELMANTPLETHAREELGIHTHNKARPVQAALVSAFTFSIGATIPILSLFLSIGQYRVTGVIIATLLSLVGLGFISAKAGGAGIKTAIFRVISWGCIAMLFGSLIGTALKPE